MRLFGLSVVVAVVNVCACWAAAYFTEYDMNRMAPAKSLTVSFEADPDDEISWELRINRWATPWMEVVAGSTLATNPDDDFWICGTGWRNDDRLPRSGLLDDINAKYLTDVFALENLASYPLKDPHNRESVSVQTFGWPMRSMWLETGLEADVGSQGVTSRGIPLSDRPKAMGGSYLAPRGLPLGILPLGFAANTSIVLVLLIFVDFTFRVARQFVRLSRGSCLRCGYALWGNQSGICPECGARFAAMEMDDRR